MNEKPTIQIATEIVRCYFGDSIRRFEADAFGNLVSLDITYEDFHPLTEVRGWLNTHIPFLWSLTVERTYSDATISSIKHVDLDDEDELIHIEELLFSQDLSDGVCHG